MKLNRECLVSLAVSAAALVALGACEADESTAGGASPRKSMGEALTAEEPPAVSAAEAAKGQVMMAAKAAGDQSSYLVHLAGLRGVTLQTVEEKFTEQAAGTPDLTSEQRAAWWSLFKSTDATLHVGWERRAHTPGTMFGWTPPLTASTPQEAWTELRQSQGENLHAMFGLGSGDDFVLIELSQGAEDVGDAPRAPRWESAQLFFWRTHDGFRVFGDHLAIDLLRDVGQTAWSLNGIRAHWFRDLPSRGFTPGADAAIAAYTTVAEHFQATSQVVAFQSEEPVYLTSDGEPGFYYAIHVTTSDGPAVAYVDPSIQEIVHLVPLSDEDTFGATIKSQVGLPYDGNKDETGSTGKRARPLANLSIYEEEELATAGDHQWTQGDETTQLGSTDLWTGAYSIDYSGGDTSWAFDLRGAWSFDQSAWCWPQISLSPFVSNPIGNALYNCTDDLTFGITAGTSFTQSKTETLHKTRRSEMYYHMDFIARVFNHASVGRPGYGALDFLYVQYTGYSGNQSPSLPDMGIFGLAVPTSFPGGSLGIRIAAMDDMDDIAHIDVERRFRGATYHEVGHTHRYKAAGSSCQIGSIADMRCLCRGWEEGRADVVKLAGTRFENVRPEYRPYLQYPDQFDILDTAYSLCSQDGLQYYRAAVFSALYGQYLLRAGHTRGLRHVYDASYLAGVDTQTAMVCWNASGGAGPCTGSMATMPENSHYMKMLAASKASGPSAAEMGAEISELFHDRVSDGDRSVSGDTPFPWYDDIPNLWPYGALVPANEFQYQASYSDGPQTGTWGSGTLRLDYGGASGGAYSGDYDSFQFLAREGKTYRIETFNLGGLADTWLEILDQDGNVVADNDDCTTSSCSWCRIGSDANHSCYDFVPDATKLYVARVRAKSYDTIGTYNLRFQAEGDDVGDSKATSNGARAAGSAYHDIDSNTDQDWYHVYAAGDFTVKACRTSGSLVPTVAVYDEADTLLLNKTMGACSSTSAETVTVSTPGYFWIKVASRTQATSGPYELTIANFTTDQDTDSTYENAIPVTLGPEQGFGLGLYMNGSEDQDWIALDAVAGYVYNIVTTPEAGVDTVVEVYAPTHVGLVGKGQATSYENSTLFKRVLCDWGADGGCLDDLGHWMLRDESDGLTGDGSSVTFSAPVDGTYYIRVMAGVESESGLYDLMMSRSKYAYTTFLAFP